MILILQTFTKGKIKVIEMAESDVIAATGCMPNCKRDTYKVEQMYYETSEHIQGAVGYDGKRVAIVSFCYAGASFLKDVEYLAYDDKVTWKGRPPIRRFLCEHKMVMKCNECAPYIPAIFRRTFWVTLAATWAFAWAGACWMLTGS